MAIIKRHQQTVTNLVTDLSTKLVASSNLSDLTDVAAARTNLGIVSQTEMQTAIDNAGLNLGTNYSVADLTARAVLTDLTIGDNVFVTDDGDTKWATYKVTAITDGDGSTSTFEKIMDQDVYENANSATAIKSSYESNADTNAYTDAEATKVGHLTVTGAIDLDANNTKLATIETGAEVNPTDAEIKTAYENNADVNVFTDAEKTKLAGIETGAEVNPTGAEIKAAYEAEGDANAFTDALLTKLNGIDDSANAYVHPSTDGSLHVPATSTTNNGKILTAGATAGALTWETLSVTKSQISDFVEGDYLTTHLTGAEIKTSYELESDTNAYTDIDSGKVGYLTVTGSVDLDAINTKLAGIPADANNYAHPTGDGSLHVPANGSTNENNVLTASGVAGTISWSPISITKSQISDFNEGDYANAGTAITGSSSQVLADATDALTLTGDTLSLARGDGSTDTIDLSAYLDEDSRSIASGTLNGATGIITFTRDDATTFTLDASGLLDDTNLVTSVDGRAGVVTLTDLYEAKDSSILKSVNIGVSVQAFDANIVSDANYVATANDFTNTLKTKLDGIEVNATADMTGAEIKAAYELETNTNAFTDDLLTKLTNVETGATADQTAGEIKTAYESNADTNAFTDADHTKLDGIEAGATGDMTGGEIKTAYEAEANTNAFTDAEQTKLAGIETGATADQTGAEIKALYEAEGDANAFTDALLTKLNGIETSATADQTKADIDALDIDAATVDGKTVGTSVPVGAVFTDTTMITEDLTVTGDDIVLTNAPVGILNFNVVRYSDGTSTYDIPVTVNGTDGTGKTYTLNGDSANQFNGNTVKIQYMY